VEGQDTLQEDEVVGFKFMPLVQSFMIFEAVFRDLGGLSDQQILDNLMAELEVKCVRVIKIVVGYDCAWGRSEIMKVEKGLRFVEGVEAYDHTVFEAETLDNFVAEGGLS
jgi:hypothetical protein